MRRFFIAAIVAGLPLTPAAADVQAIHPAPGLEGYDVPFWPGGTYREDVASPEAYLGYPVGSRPAPHADIVRYFRYLDQTVPGVTLHEYARTYEGRECVYLVIASPEHAENLEEIRADLRKLADPRLVRGSSEARSIVERSPAVAWLGYGIHGNELSSCDAAMQLAWQLAAGTDDDTRGILEGTVVVIDPVENPDGRTRCLGALEQWRGVAPNYDVQSLHHSGFWPSGRTNHYLFDLNRDWFTNIHPETRGRTRAIADWLPHYFVDVHEMGSSDTYLFSPPREPFNPYMTTYVRKWWDRVAEDQADAFDRYGWSYYTREWNEEFFPGYGSSWSIYLGSVGMLFEQARVDGSAVRRPDGSLMSYREAVHHQFVGSISNLLTVADGREELLSDFYQQKLANVRSRGGAFLFPPSQNLSRLERLVATLQHQNIEVEQATASFRAGRVRAVSGEALRNRSFPAGTVVVRTNQPLKQLVEVILSFDIRIPTSFLRVEKKEILKHRRSKLYDATGWSLPVAYGLEAYFADAAPRVDTEPYRRAPRAGGLAGDDSAAGFVFDCTDDRAYHLLARLLDRGHRVRSSRKPFSVGGREFPRGSYLLRRSDNPDVNADELRALAEEAGVEMHSAASGLGHGPYPDLGGGEFKLLREPRIAIVGGAGVRANNFGAIWHLVDNRLGLRASTLDVSSLARVDLRKYNVLVLPHGWRAVADYKRMLGEPGIKRVKEWVRSGGTLIAEGAAAAFLADTSVAVSAVRQRRQSLEKLSLYEDALAAARHVESPEVDSLALWEEGEAAGEVGDDEEASEINLERLEQRDTTARRLYPRGSILAVDLDPEHWLTVGCGESVPVMFNSSYAYLARGRVRVAGRLATADRLRISGLLWEEARDRWAQSAYLTREASDRGQIILFATAPNFRGYFHGAERLLLNALLLGPGLGTQPPAEW